MYVYEKLSRNCQLFSDVSIFIHFFFLQNAICFYIIWNNLNTPLLNLEPSWLLPLNTLIGWPSTTAGDLGILSWYMIVKNVTKTLRSKKWYLRGTFYFFFANFLVVFFFCLIEVKCMELLQEDCIFGILGTKFWRLLMTWWKNLRSTYSKYKKILIYQRRSLCVDWVETFYSFLWNSWKN